MGIETRWGAGLLLASVLGVVLFDPETVADRATTDEPHERAAGIERVWVNGQPAYPDGWKNGQGSGRVLRRQSRL